MEFVCYKGSNDWCCATALAERSSTAYIAGKTQYAIMPDSPATKQITGRPCNAHKSATPSGFKSRIVDTTHYKGVENGHRNQTV